MAHRGPSSASRDLADEAPWREPGQTKDPWYLAHGALRYSAARRCIVGRDRTCLNNRPLYCYPDGMHFVLAGDRPLLRLIDRGTGSGTVWAGGVVRNGNGRWLHECASVESRYRCGHMTWTIADPSVEGARVTLEVVPLSARSGYALRMRVASAREGDQLVWTLGGSRPRGTVPGDASANTGWDPVMHGNPPIFRLGDPRKPETRIALVPEECADASVSVGPDRFRYSLAGDASEVTVGRIDHAGAMMLGDASTWDDPVSLAGSAAAAFPVICGIVPLGGCSDQACWVVRIDEGPRREPGAPARAFAQAAAHLKTTERVRVDTPEPRLDAAVAAVCHAIDATCDRESPVFRHGAMSFFTHFLGWRVICGSTALGWHDRVAANARHYLSHQVLDDATRVGSEPDLRVLGVHEGPESRFHGRGKISNSPAMYNTQSQFFDQTLRDWRWTADPELEQWLRPALDLHLKWARECFDPDDDGLYESYINTLPTDSVWYSGGGGAEETAYAYYGHVAACDMARRAGDSAPAARHLARANKIRRALRDKLWVKDRGHVGLYLEQGGHGRVHTDAWVYSQFLPIDANMCTPDEAIQALYWTEWYLERVRLPFGGELCQLSNWVPSVWSVRDVFNGDLWALALAYQGLALADEAWDLLLGAMLETCYASAMPGGFSHIGAGGDFSDCSNMFARVVVEGLFGYRPDYPNGIVRVQPAFPSAWPRAAVRTPDYTLAFRRRGNADRYHLSLRQPSVVEFRVPVRAHQIRNVMLDGLPAGWSVEAGYGCTLVTVRSDAPVSSADLVVEVQRRVPREAAPHVTARAGDKLCLVPSCGQVRGWRDLHHVLSGAGTDGSAVVGRVRPLPGHHLVLAHVQVGDLPQVQAFKVHVLDPRADAAVAARTPREAPTDAGWECVDISGICNSDVRTIFQHRYESPRPKTCSVRIGTDGWSAWTFPYWKYQPPEIDLRNIPALSVDGGRLMTPQNVPFASFGEPANIAFTSLWDNWPASVTANVQRRADTAWLLVCGSTNPMQLRIANAEVRFRYADGRVERLELVPPVNFWSLSSWGCVDYSYELDGFALPPTPPPMVQLGKECRAMLLSWRLLPGAILQDVTLETLSQEVVIGLMGISLQDPDAGL